jgi:murein endopeptidase
MLRLFCPTFLCVPLALMLALPATGLDGPQKPLSGDDGCGQELTNWYAMLKKAAIREWRSSQRQERHASPHSLWPSSRRSAVQC